MKKGIRKHLTGSFIIIGLIILYFLLPLDLKQNVLGLTSTLLSTVAVAMIITSLIHYYLEFKYIKKDTDEDDEKLKAIRNSSVENAKDVNQHQIAERQEAICVKKTLEFIIYYIVVLITIYLLKRYTA